jgi:hypothetical protein
MLVDLRQFAEQCLCGTQVGGFEALSEPAEGWSEQRAGVTAPPLIAPQVREAQSCAKLERLGALRAGYRYRPRKAGFDRKCGSARLPRKWELAIKN